MIVGFLVVALAASAFALSQRGDRPDEQSTIDTVSVDRGDITQMISTTGAVRALITVEVGSQLSGQIAELHADFNAPVRENDLLALIDPQTFERRVREAEANLAVAEANIAVQTAAIERAEATLNNAARNFDRQRSLVDRNIVSEAALDEAQAAFESAEADLASAKAQLITAEATVQQRAAALDAAQIDLDRTQIRSPIDGVVIDRAVDIGQTVAASLSAPILFTIAQDLTEIQIEADVDEADIGAVRAGATATFSVDAYPDREFRGEVTQVRLAPNEEQNVVTYTVIISARNPDRGLYPGMTANVDIITGAREDVLRVANAAVRFRAPDDWPTPEGGAAAGRGPGGPPGGGPGGPGGGPGGAMMSSLDDLGVAEDVRAEIQQEMQGVFGQMQAAFSDPTADRAAMRDRIRTQIDAIIRDRLTPEQTAAYEELQAAAQNTRSAVIYVTGEDGEPEPRQVMLGISDTTHTEIVRGDLSESDAVVTRVRRTSGR